MVSFNARLEQIQLLVDRVQHHNPHEGGVGLALYEKLLTMSEQLDNPYGRALAHANLARHYQQHQDDVRYHLHLERAQQEAAFKNYFDVQIFCLELEGWRNAEQCDEVTALAQLLQGRKIAEEIKDRRAQARMDVGIAKLFCASGAYDNALRFYEQASQALEQVPTGNVAYQRKAVLLNLQYMACAQENLAQARDYQARSYEIPCEAEDMGLFAQAVDVSVLLLADDRDRGRTQALALLEQLRRSQLEPHILCGVHFLLLEQLLFLRLPDEAAWCLEQLETLYGSSPLRTLLRLQRAKVRYAELFGVRSTQTYARVYETTLRGEAAHRQSTAQSFQSLIALHDAEKARDRLLEEQTDLQLAASMDELTKIHNRRYLGKLISKLVQDDRLQSLGYIMVDVDFFKEYNDHYGHSKGDAALVAVAALLEQCLPKGAYVARYGGDEFSCLFVNCSQSELVDFVKRVQQRLNLPHARSTIADRLTLTFGIHNELRPHGCDESLLLRRADEALYRAKRAGRNTYAVSAEGGDT